MSSSSTLYSGRLKRLKRERRMFPELQSHLSELYEMPDKYLGWTLSIPGPQGSPYEGQTLYLEIAYEPAYPFRAPLLRFVPPVFHPNVHPSGLMSNLMVDTWTCFNTVMTIYENAQHLLANPYKEFPYNDTAMLAWQRGPEIFRAAVLAHAHPKDT